MARVAVLAPDGSGILVWNEEPSADTAGVTFMRATPDGVEQERLFLLEDYELVPSMSANVAHDGTLLIRGYLLRPSR
jgi:hypothetical protein